MNSDLSAMPSFEQQRCNGCRLCMSVCQHGGFVINGELISVNYEAECDSCQDCELVCPTGAISFAFDVVDESEQ